MCLRHAFCKRLWAALAVPHVRLLGGVRMALTLPGCFLRPNAFCVCAARVLRTDNTRCGVPKCWVRTSWRPYARSSALSHAGRGAWLHARARCSFWVPASSGSWKLSFRGLLVGCVPHSRLCVCQSRCRCIIVGRPKLSAFRRFATSVWWRCRHRERGRWRWRPGA